MLPPEVVIINSTAVRVIWTSPSNPNGVVTEYSVYVNNKLYKTGMNAPGSFVLGDLSPFTIYDIQVEVCTKYACVKSQGTKITTVEDTPCEIAAPKIHIISSRSLQIDWESPAQPNGLILGYELLRKTWYSCTISQKVIGNQNDGFCRIIRCQKPDNICGHMCYSPESKVCCNGILYDLKLGYVCCEDNYIPFGPNSSRICCGGRMHEIQPKYQCCSGYYTRVLLGEICCLDDEYKRVSVGIGDTCCKNIPYSTSGNQICCAGVLHDGYKQQCCGGKVVSKELVCCGGEEEGSVHISLPEMFCCGQDYVNMSDTICCSASSGESKAHVKKNDPVPIKCCETELIPETQECCNGVGYNPLKYVCSDKISAGMMMKEIKECRPASLCPISKKDAAYCGRCDFNLTSHVCALIRNPQQSPQKLSYEDTCPSAEETVYTGNTSTYSFTDVNLEPYTMYEYRIAAWNSHGQGFSKVAKTSTKQDVPQGVSPPTWTKMDNREDVIVLNWKKPIQPNGVIIHYIVLRNGIERFRGTEMSFVDTNGVHPYQEYSYQLRVCTVSGCTDSYQVVAATIQGVPESVLPPKITALSAEVLYLSWRVPEKPNGIIREYRIYQSGKGLIHIDKGKMEHTVTGLCAYTNYSFTLTACTSVGCTTSQPIVSRTLQAAPQGVWSIPRHIIINSTTVELYWNEPEKPNGLISKYQLHRNGTVIFLGGREDQNFTDDSLEPKSSYVYQLEVHTGGGSNTSDDYVVQTPESTPEEIYAPYNVTVVDPYSIFVAWSPSGETHVPKVPLQYNVLLNPGSVEPLIYPVGHHHLTVVKNLTPYTQYEVRIQACQNGDCGVSSGTLVTTFEAAPLDLKPPFLLTMGPTSILIRWLPPTKPNGIIINYFIYRRTVGIEGESLLFIWSEGSLEFTDASDTLKPFTLYEYRVRAHNSKGSVESPWSSAQTMEAPPMGMQAPQVQATSAYSVLLNWTKPESPNGIISQYRIIYQERQKDPIFNVPTVTAFTVMGTRHQAHLFGLEPFTTYHIGIVAVNLVGEVSSPWTTVCTLESSPSGLSNFTVERKEDGHALLLQWSEPVRTNGVIKAYNIFSDGSLEYTGLSRQFLFRRLEPFTLYVLTLEACTTAGCTLSTPQALWTAEAPPTSQLAPTIQSVEATSIELSWSEPINPNGKIIHYEVIHRCFKGYAGGNRTTEADEKIVFTEYNTERNTFAYNDKGLQPWTLYEYKIRTWNSAGHTDSPWSAVKTKQAPPEGLLPPDLVFESFNPRRLIISWAPPAQPNGIIHSYRLQRNEALYPFNFDAETFNYTDDELLPYSEYSYAVIACTAEGCSTSQVSTIKTPEAAPALVNPPSLWALTATQINASWSPPPTPNGEIIRYFLQFDDQEYHAGKNLSGVVSQLQPYTQYEFTLIACTIGGCTASKTKSIRTMEAPPQSMSSPKVQATGSESVEITWKVPARPNGQITNYEVKRDGEIIYTGMETRYHDLNLSSGKEYGYTVTATNSQGSTSSPLVKVRTNPSAPSGMAPPELQAWNSQEIKVNWDPPVKTSGDIINYTLRIWDPVETEAEAIHMNTTHNSFAKRSFMVTQLKPFHRYEIRIQGCTLLGCASSDWSSIQTPETSPMLQPPPILDVQMGPRGFQPRVSLQWTGPLQPNGKILYFELYRRQVTALPGTSSPVLVYNGTLTSFTDSELLPFTEYEYQVWSGNSAGKSPSSWVQCKTGPAPPEGLQAPKFHAIFSTQAVVNISPPLKPNGIVSLYRLFSNHTRGTENVLSEGMAIQQTIHDLEPFTTYSIGVEACTCFNCCSKGPVAQLTTHPAPPSQQPPPQIQTLTSRTASFQWNPPSSPNGIVESYELELYIPCPLTAEMPCTPGPTEIKYTGQSQSASIGDLQPYTSYMLRVVAYNMVGSTASEWISFTTEKEFPQYRAPFSVASNLSVVYINWSGTFLLNGKLKEYILTDGGQRLYSGLDTSLYIPRTADRTFLFQVTCTTDEGSVKTPLIQYDTSTGLGPELTTPGEKMGAGSKHAEFYNELWFIILMATLGLILLAIFLSLILQRKIHKEPYIRERPPLVPLQKRMTPLSVYPPGETHMYVDDEDLMNAIKGFSSVTKEHTTFTDTHL
ncbi:usherin isoform X2 [Monodelphis domestica]|uniref:usherin isoform X2 n=1 Tax=Monodelphis domestica TaxID=13616 RepID=UPI0024E20F8B|nr:usherin isoform X2 [Monodelphis domestica]